MAEQAKPKPQATATSVGMFRDSFIVPDKGRGRKAIAFPVALFFHLGIIAGILTIVGFSINDTIVIFDRVRENLKIMRGKGLEEVMNVSLNQCLGRTIITSGTVLLTVGALFLFGGDVINDFAFLMLIGTIEGVYSTIYLSCPVVLFWQSWFGSKKAGRR